MNILVASLAAVAVAGALWEMPRLAHHLMLAVVAGAILFSVIKEEIPPERQSKFWPALAGVIIASLLLRLVD